MVFWSKMYHPQEVEARENQDFESDEEMTSETEETDDD